MLPKYANLENDPNNFVQASRTIRNYNNQIVSNLKEDRNPTSSGISPKNEYEEFNSNLTEINTYITQLKTYVNDNKRKEFNNQKRDAEKYNRNMQEEAAERGEVEAVHGMSIIDDPDFYYNIIDKEALRIGTLPKINLVNLHQTGDYNKNEVEMFKKVKEMQGTGRLVGGAETERQDLEERISEKNEENQKLYILDKTFKKAYKDMKLSVDTAEETEKVKNYTDLIENGERTLDGFPTSGQITDISSYFKNTIGQNMSDIQDLTRDIGNDYNEESVIVTKDQAQELDDIKTDSDLIDGMSAAEFTKLKQKYKIHGTSGREKVKAELKTRMRNLKGRIKSYSEPNKIEANKQFSKLPVIGADKQRIIEQIDDGLQALLVEIDAELTERERRLLEIEQQIEQARIDAEKAEKIGEAREAERLQKEAEQLQKQAEDEQEQIRVLQEEEQRLAEEAEDQKQKALADEEYQLIEKQATDELSRKKAIGALASSVPNVNPIIGTLTKLISLISKQNILFNSKIKKNINLLDRLDVEDLISKLNKTISNVTNINLSYIIVSIENGFEMLEQLFTSLNKLSFDVSNSIYNYTSSLRGGTRYINDHLQHFKFRNMSSNPHPYHYMM